MDIIAKIRSKRRRDIAYIVVQLVWFLSLIVIGLSNVEDKLLLLLFVLMNMRFSELENMLEDMKD